ncbi:TIGR02646 family protein [Rhizobium leguminosarum]|uniref:retron system putative HNH endonuclease n=1 Tax=Rhizobium ruizarguesonis TaxID=2081791 RepID=UPI0013CDCB77|nr:retron system putative HNH endonuclease [Rhizobium ruizarguesonis]NEJ60791.1 TIGR02646 family protein [Rhizobium ruizarguesonis]
MHHLDRAATPAPACLGSYNHGAHDWRDLDLLHKEQIRQCLEQMQGRRCAYCEGSIDALGQHIEHFRRKSTFPPLTFDWSNLYWSCDQTDSCGHYKDHGAGPYNVADLINPCLDNPDDFFLFRADGTISIRAGLPEQNQHRAVETLRVFGLDAQWGRLRNMRKGAVAGYVRDAEEAMEAGLEPEELHEYFSEALEAAATEPFPTVVRHVLTERP